MSRLPISSAPGASVYDPGAMRSTKDRIPAGRKGARGASRLPAVLLLVLPVPLLVPGLFPAPAPAAETATGTPTGTATRTGPLARPAPPGPGAPDPGTPDPAAADLFAMPAVTADIRRAFAPADAGDVAGAAAILDRALVAHPGIAALHAARAGVAMIEGTPDAALDQLAAAAAIGGAGGLPDPAAVAGDPVFAPLAADPALAPRLAAVAATPPAPPPAPVPAAIADGIAPVTAANTVWNPATERLEAAFAPPVSGPADRPGPVLPPRPKTGALDLLREHWKRGRAAGNAGDLYDNRDRGHSALKPEAFPQLAHVAYSPEARDAELDYGLQDKLLFDRPVFGNSSTAVTGGLLWRSLPRLAMTQGDGTGPLRLWQNAEANALYIYPAHKDWTKEQGDLFPANTPYILVSHGSSGSDQPFLEALALTYAAFRPDTKARLVALHLIVPTVQMIFRRSLQHVTSRDSYMSGEANPAAFEGYTINPARMVSLAQSIRPDAIPPEVRIAVTAEDLGREGIDYFGEGLSEQLFDTPGAVARIWRSKAATRTMTVSAAETRDPNGRPLEFRWRLLQGDPSKVTITPSEDGTSATITLAWHDPFVISDDNPVTSSRVDIGVFASNGVHDSAPAILSWYFPPSEKRTLETAPDGTLRTAAIDHENPDRAYADPILVPRTDWRDDFAYAADGSLAGWTRTRPGTSPDAPPETFDALGRRLPDPADPATAIAVAYPLSRADNGRLVVGEVDAAPF